MSTGSFPVNGNNRILYNRTDGEYRIHITQTIRSNSNIEVPINYEVVMELLFEALDDVILRLKENEFI